MDSEPRPGMLQNASALKVTIHDGAASFLATAGAFLARAECENSTIAVPAARMRTSPRDDDRNACFASVGDATGVVCVAMRSPPGIVMLSAGPDAAVEAIAHSLREREWRLTGIVGPLDACETFAREWKALTGEAHTLRVHLRHFELARMPELPAAKGAMRLPQPTEGDEIAAWQVAFADEIGLRAEASLHRQNAAHRIAAGASRVWDDEGMVSYASFAGDAETARVAPVYTPPERRGRGYGSALVASLSRELLAGGRRVFITTDVANPVSNRIYQRIGYRPVADHYGFDFVASPS